MPTSYEDILISLLYIKNRSIPSIKPKGTPSLTDYFYNNPETNTFSSIFKYDFNHKHKKE